MIKTATSKILDWGNKLALAVFSASVALVFVASQWEYAAKSPLADYNVWFMLLGLLLGVLVVGTYQTITGKKNLQNIASQKNGFAIFILIFTLLLCILKWYITAQTWFITDWDAGVAMKTAFYGIDEWGTYSVYPNNLFVVGLFKAIIDLVRLFIPNFNVAYLTVIQIGGTIVCISCALVAYASKNISGNVGTGYAVFALETVFVIVSPWSLVPYTDSYGMLAPAICLYIYSLSISCCAKFPAIIGVAVLGCAVKPNAIIPCIAIFIVELTQIVAHDTREKRKIGTGVVTVCLSLMTIICVEAITSAIKSYTNIEINPEASMSPAHYLMMGSNEEAGGGYCQDDVNFSLSITSYDERAAQNLTVFGNRIKEMGAKGIIKQIARKTLSNYADGSGSWRMEGSFFVEIKGESEALKRFYGIGSFEPCGYTILAQILWMFILIGLVLQWLDTKKSLQIAVVNITLLGQSLFLILFECRARYFVQFWPYFTVAAVTGWDSFYRKMIEKRMKKES